MIGKAQTSKAARTRSKNIFLLLVLAALLVWLGYELHGAYQRRVTRFAYSQPRSVIEDQTRWPRVLILGNSLTYAYDIPKMTESLVQQLSPEWRVALVTSIAPSGHHLHDHLGDLRGSHAFIPRDIEHALSPESRWHTVVMQDGSMVMSLPDGHEVRERAMKAIPELGELIADSGAQPMLYVTWGYSPTHTPDFTEEQSVEMAARISRGYHEAGGLIDGRVPSERGTHYLPAGEAFERARTRHAEIYPQLFVDDRHPSLEGAYLVASLLAATLTGERVLLARWYPEGMTEKEARRLRLIADDLLYH